MHVLHHSVITGWSGVREGVFLELMVEQTAPICIFTTLCSKHGDEGVGKPFYSPYLPPPPPPPFMSLYIYILHWIELKTTSIIGPVFMRSPKIYPQNRVKGVHHQKKY